MLKSAIPRENVRETPASELKRLSSPRFHELASAFPRLSVRVPPSLNPKVAEHSLNKSRKHSGYRGQTPVLLRGIADRLTLQPRGIADTKIALGRSRTTSSARAGRGQTSPILGGSRTARSPAAAANRILDRHGPLMLWDRPRRLGSAFSFLSPPRVPRERTGANKSTSANPGASCALRRNKREGEGARTAAPMEICVTLTAAIRRRCR